MTIAPGGGKAKRRCLATKSLGELGEVCATSPSPAINGLVGVADGHHAVGGKQRGQQTRLSNAGVLVFIEEHHLIVSFDRHGNVRISLHQQQRQRNLVRKLKNTADLFSSLIFLNQLHQGHQAPDGVHPLIHLGIATPTPGGEIR